jgi:putative SOS response-associated peptidase YedK
VAEAVRAIGADPGAEVYPQRFNVAPTQGMPVVIAPAGQPQAITMRWGIVPFYARKDPKPQQLINARSETVTEKVTFRQSVQKRRCLVPADGFYEWLRESPARKTPYYIRLRSGAPFWIAGIYEKAAPPFDAGYALLTTRPNELMRPIHDRMPVILPTSNALDWLKPGPIAPALVAQFSEPYPAEEMCAHPVSTIVNNARHDVPECVVPV